MDLFNTKPRQKNGKKTNPKLIMGAILAITLIGWVLGPGAISNISWLLFWITAAVVVLYNLYTLVKKLKPAFSK
ncbi:MAG: hypothetical protein PHV51_07815 [Methanosarcinaceae archaeon]|nr:hypothetical protein [Methanosarcinaceae archaeon]MDD4498036.1 hypothetical protein [Methanosarcinaceae archaeon]